MISKNPETCVKSKGIYFNKENIPFFKTKRTIDIIKPAIIEDDDESLDEEDTIPHASIIPHMRTNERIIQDKRPMEVKFSSKTSSLNPSLIAKEFSKEVDLFTKKIQDLWINYLNIILDESVNITKIMQDEYYKKCYDFYNCIVFKKANEIEKLCPKELKKFALKIPVNSHYKYR